jgi:hypothetical protein
MYSAGGTQAFPWVGFPIRVSPDQSPLGGSPRLIAACHALLRPLTPRHPPSALSSLTMRFGGIESLAFCSVVKVLVQCPVTHKRPGTPPRPQSTPRDTQSLQLGLSFALVLHNPYSYQVPTESIQDYRRFVKSAFLKAGVVTAPFARFSPAVHCSGRSWWS